MSKRTRTFVGLIVLMVASGCSARHILRMSNPEKASAVALFDAGGTVGEDDDTVIVLDEPARIAKVAAFFEARAEKWDRYAGKANVHRRYQISFRRGEEVTDQFWIAGNRLLLHTPSGAYYTCELSDAEIAELLEIFRFTTNFKSSK